MLAPQGVEVVNFLYFRHQDARMRGEISVEPGGPRPLRAHPEKKDLPAKVRCFGGTTRVRGPSHADSPGLSVDGLSAQVASISADRANIESAKPLRQGAFREKSPVLPAAGWKT